LSDFLSFVIQIIMERKQRKHASVAERGRKKCTESLKDLLGSVGINDTNDWLDYVNKIGE